MNHKFPINSFGYLTYIGKPIRCHEYINNLNPKIIGYSIKIIDDYIELIWFFNGYITEEMAVDFLYENNLIIKDYINEIGYFTKIGEVILRIPICIWKLRISNNLPKEIKLKP